VGHGSFLLEGFVMDDERLKNPPGRGAPDYFDELLERIRDIRASERRMYTRVRDLLALAADYQPSHSETQSVFRIVQNKLHFAATGMTASELIAARADATKPNMGLTSWKGDAVRKGDVGVAKNYLNADEIGELNRIVVMFLDYAEDQARRRKQIFLRDWEAKLDEFLKFNDRNVLQNAGGVSREDADRQAKRSTRDSMCGAARNAKQRARPMRSMLSRASHANWSAATSRAVGAERDSFRERARPHVPRAVHSSRTSATSPARSPARKVGSRASSASR
jgi:hypothetical protein